MADLMAFFSRHPTLSQVIQLIGISIVTIIVLIFVLRMERRVAKRLLAKKDKINARFVESTVRFVLIVVAVMWIVMSSPITQPFGQLFFQGTAIIGAIAGFAAQPVIADMICGLMLSATQPFDIGDRIELEDGVAGVVKDITLRHVVLQTIDSVRVVIPNSKLNSMRVTNMNYHTRTRSVHFRFVVALEADPDLARQVIRQAVQDSPYTLPGLPVAGGYEYGDVYFIEYTDSGMRMAVTAYYEPVHRAEVVKDDVNTRVKRALDANGIVIPYNTITVTTGSP